MKDQFMSDNLNKLICAMADPKLGRNDVMDMLIKYVPAVAEDMGLTSLGYDVAVPATFGSGGMYEKGEIYSSDGSRAVTLEERFETKNGGTFIMNGTSAEEDEQQRAAFHAVANLLFAMCGKINSVSDLQSLAVTDYLTGALNMNGFRRTVIPMLNRTGTGGYASVFLNIKNFKYINQKIGMPNGDKILRELVARFKAGFEKRCGYIARLGADNFVLLFKAEDVMSLLDMLKSFNVTLSGNAGTAEIKVYFRAGLYYTEDNIAFDDIMNRCTCAYASAKNGKTNDFVVFEPYMIDAENRTKKVLVTFPEAIKNREFQVYYQPKVRSSDNVMVGAEALCRWIRHGKVIPPADFIPVLERFGNISQLDLYVVETVAQDLRGWLDKGITPVRTSLNISRRDLLVPKLAERINEIVDRYRIPHDLIEIELTETYTTDEFSMMLRLINELRDFGFKISIDDFGSGYSTLTMLKSIHADIIKLDRAFIKDMTESSNEDRIILRNVVHMVNELKIEVIAEGIETAEQVNFLDTIGCGVIQGFYYDRPLPHDEFDIRLTDPKWYIKKAGEVVV